MNFGLTCAPSVFQRLIDLMLSGLSYRSCLVHLNDVIVFGHSFDEATDELEKVSKLVQRARLKLKPSLFQRSVEFLGHVVFEAGIAMQEDKIAAIRDWPSCQSITEVPAFTGSSRYDRFFHYRFAAV